MKKLWGGRFKQSTDALMETFSASISFDKRLYACDIEGSIAHCKMLGHCKIITASESQKIQKGLKRILRECEEGRFEFSDKLEDIHMNIESRLRDIIGPTAGKLHTARSRNDQVCLDIRLYLRNEVDEAVHEIDRLCKALVGLAKKNIDRVIPGYTHLQRAQPVLLSHHLLAYVEMLLRDKERFLDARKRINIMPLGSAALAGTNFPIDRHYTAKLLKFPEISHNSMDAVADRDFAAEFCSASAILMMHLSRFCEELVIWNSSEFGFVELSDAFTTGSSIMPQKKNPDAAELIRGKSGRVFGNLVSLLTLMKGLPMAYNKDLQEDKEPLFDSADTIKVCLQIFTDMMKSTKFKTLTSEDLENSGFLTATDMADYLVLKGVPFREAHEITGKTVAYCLDEGKTLSKLTLAELRKISRRFEEDVAEHIALENSVDRKNIHGGTAKKQVKAQIARLTKKLK
ncbi:MAG: argininosuccinate lyase [Nitrospinaceae bacterium]|nr:argininosuccinate lyase [Nitrospina sp.]MBT5375749.1 argininosuccinate lyase [Nitrospinaceae bacterium]MBT6345393.1 argininosuccinate lyase [Nitrospina sp.]